MAPYLQRPAPSTACPIASRPVTVRRLPDHRIQHVFTVDVEEYFHVSAFAGTIAPSTWDSLPSRVSESVDLLLDCLSRHEATGTFFVLGWVADRHPHVVRRIAAAGHEIASHGWWHRRVSTLTRAEFRDDVRASRALLEDISQQPVLGFRAPSFSILPGGEWAFDVLLEEGYHYDSSLFPIRRPGYGYPTAPPVPHAIARPAGTLCELPLATYRAGPLRLPAAGGAYLRHFPLRLLRSAFREYDRDGIPAVLYVHPWEVDPEQPRMSVSPLTRARHYGGLRRTLPRLERLLSEFRFTSARDSLQRSAVLPPAGPRAAVAPR